MFEYDQPMGRQKVAAANARSPDRAIGSSVLHLAQLLIRRAVWIVGAALICACIAVVIGKSMTPRYSASTQLYVDPRELQLVERELAPRSQDLTGLGMVVESQVRVITSNNVLLKVIGDLDLEKDPEFGGKSPMGFLFGLFSFGSDSASKKSDERAGALEALRRHINVKRTDRTFIVDIEAWSNEATKAATLANAIASAYLEESRESQSAAARRATTDLSARLKELQERLRLNENNLATYKARNNFVGSQDTQVSDQQLLSSTQRLANAQAATLDARAKYNQIEASRKNATDPGAIPEALQSPTIASLRTQFSETRRRQAELQSELGPLHPAVRMVDKQVEDVRRNISEEIARFAQSAKNDLTRAQDLEASLLKSLDGQKRQSADLTQASVKLRELEREAEASRTIYQSFLKRSRETEEQESLNTSSARITGEATVPQRRVFPPAMSLLAMIGFVLGGLAAIGCVIAWDTLAPRKEDALVPIPARAKDVGAETPKQAPAPAQATLLQRPAPSPVQASSPPQVSPPPPMAPTPQMAPTPRISSPSQTTSDRLYFRLQETDVLRTLNGIFPLSGSPDIVRLGWPTINPGPAATRFTATALRLADLAKARTKPGHATTIATIGIACDDERTIVALNLALAIKQTGARVLLIDADRFVHALSSRLNSRATTSQLIGSMMDTVQPAPETMSGVAIQAIDFARGGNALIKAVDEARMSGLYDLIVLDGPAIPAIEPDRRLFESIDGALAVLPAHLPASEHLDKTIAALPGGENKFLAVMFSELAVKPREGASAPQYA